MTFFRGTVWAEGDSLSSEKVAKMIADDNILKGFADLAPLGILKYVSSTGSTTVATTSFVSVEIIDVWIPFENRMIKWDITRATTDHNNIVTPNRTKIVFEVDGIQVYEAWSDSVDTTVGLHVDIPAQSILIGGLDAGNHTFEIKAALTAASPFTDLLTFRTFISDAGKNIASQ